MNEMEYRQRMEQAWRARMTAAEEAECRAWLARHPEYRGLWEAEQGLSQVLERLPDVPVPSNFTARVMAMTTAEGGQTARGIGGARVAWGWWRRWWPRVALGSALVVVAGIGVRMMRERERQWLASGIPVARVLVALPQPEVLRDFEAIEQLANTPPATLVDMDLLTALE